MNEVLCLFVCMITRCCCSAAAAPAAAAPAAAAGLAGYFLSPLFRVVLSIYYFPVCLIPFSGLLRRR